MFEENENYLFNNDNINSENKIFEFNVNDNALLIENILFSELILSLLKR